MRLPWWRCGKCGKRSWWFRHACRSCLRAFWVRVFSQGAAVAVDEIRAMEANRRVRMATSQELN